MTLGATDDDPPALSRWRFRRVRFRVSTIFGPRTGFRVFGVGHYGRRQSNQLRFRVRAWEGVQFDRG